MYLLESTDEEEDENADSDVNSEADLFLDQNPIPEDMVANQPIPMSEFGQYPFHPRDRHVSWEECNPLERARLLVELENAERVATAIICDTNRAEGTYHRKADYLRGEAENKKGEYTEEGLKKFEKEIKRFKTKLRERQRILLRELRVARRNQAYLSQQLQAVLNGILFRALHPNQPFVIFIRENNVILQQTRHPANDFRDVQTSTPAPPHRRPRSDLHPDHSQSCSQAATRFDLINVTNIEFEIVEADSVISYLGLATSHSKLIKITIVQPQKIEFEEKLMATNDLFSAFSWTLSGYQTSLYYHNLWEPAHEEMTKINKLMNKEGLDIKKKINVLTYVKNHLMFEFNKQDLKWEYHPYDAIAETIKILKNASMKLLMWNTKFSVKILTNK